MRRGVQAGFTVIEVVLAMAVSVTLLFLMVGQHQSLDNTSFTGGLDDIRDKLASIKNEAISTVNEQGCGGNENAKPGCNTSLGNSGFYYIAWGKGAEIQNNTITVYTLKAKVDVDGNLQNPVQNIQERVITLKDNITTTAHVCVAFLRDPMTGGLETSFPACNWPAVPSQYPLATALQNIIFTGPQGQHGTITIDPVAAAIKRSAP